ncbi:MAG TPA: AAA family ATPase, partial [Bryobacteraceae bacterium]
MTPEPEATRTIESPGGGAVEPAPAVEFTGTERFEVRRQLGAGGFGAVYEVYDREHDALIALKTLHRMSARGIQRLKREFRALADITHPNLVAFYELVADGELCVFTMELVDGCDFLQHVRLAGACDFARLRDALIQLAAGVCAVHGAGKLHLDLKPSNVLVSREGRVVIVDFGLVSDIEPRNRGMPLPAGTLAYMPPEQPDGNVSPAADWYAVGVMLYEALTGRHPSRINGPEPVPPSHLDAQTPADLDELCRRLLRWDPRERPSGREVLRLLTGSDDMPAPVRDAPLVGRAREMAALRGAFDTAGGGGTAVVCVTGPSGAGKTALVRQFVRELPRDGTALALSGRCYAQETVPYNAFDELVDGMALHVEAFEPRDAALCARLFPAFPVPAAGSGERIESQELRQAAFGAFRRSIARLARGRAFALHLDDLQWANPDSIQLLAEILRPPDIPGLLLILGIRDDASLPLPLPKSTVRLDLGSLDGEDATRLAESLLPADLRVRAPSIASDAGGNPFLLTQLAQHARAARGGQATVSLEAMLQARVANLPQAARRMLEAVSVAGRPVDAHVAWTATRQEAGEQSAVAALRASRLIRIQRSGERYEVEPYHDRIRQAIESGLDRASRARQHLHLGLELEAAGRTAPDWLATHFREGGDRPRTLRYSLAAAEQASRALAFEAAVKWYRI